MKSAFAVEVEDQLVKSAQCGDREALYELYKLFERPAYTLACRLCQSSEEAQDVLQDGMLQLVENIDQFRFEAPFWSWVRRLFINVCLMHLRRRKKDDNVEVLIDEMAVTEANILAMERDILAAFSRLAPERRTVLWLYAVEGYTHREIADMLDYSPSYSKTQLMRARRQIKQWWREDTPDNAVSSEYYDDQQ